MYVYIIYMHFMSDHLFTYWQYFLFNSWLLFQDIYRSALSILYWPSCVRLCDYFITILFFSSPFSTTSSSSRVYVFCVWPLCTDFLSEYNDANRVTIPSHVQFVKHKSLCRSGNLFCADPRVFYVILLVHFVAKNSYVYSD